MRSVISTLLFLFAAFHVFSQTENNPWQNVSEKSFAKPEAVRRIVPQKYRTLSLNLDMVNDILAKAPLRFSSSTETKKTAAPSLWLPLPDGKFREFRIEEAPVMHPDLAAKFPYMRSFSGWSVEDPTAYLRCGITQKGFHAMIISARHSTVYIDAYALDDTEHYLCYFKKDFSSEEPFHCELDGLPQDKSLIQGSQPTAGTLAGDCKLRTYALALACTGEYAQYHGGTVPLVMAEFNLAVTRISGIYERELGVTFQLVPNNNLLVFLNPAIDPYDNNNNNAMLAQNQTTCNNIIGAGNYDIGHVFATGGGGVAYLQAVCGSLKAGGVSARSNPTGDPFWVDYVCHEMGHQFGGNHTQNNDCNRSAATAMETGSGVTIMGYAGVCTPNVQNNSIDNFHAVSLDEMAAFIITGGNACATTTVTSNNPPAVTVASSSYTIPKSTPFVLTAIGSDPDGGGLTYTWDQMDPEVATQPPLSTNTAGPSFRCFSPSASPSRYFPNLNTIVNNTNATWEVLPSVGRTMNFRCTVRDNFPGAGCTDEVDVTLIVSNGAGPFTVMSPNTSSVTWPASSMQTVTWNVANTNMAPVSCSQVEILLSIDGGFTYPYTLSSGTNNDGSHTIQVPGNIPNSTNQARVMVKGKGNVFFDISNQNFSITAPPSFVLETTSGSAAACLTGEASYFIDVQQISGYNQPVSFSASGLPAGGIATFNPTQATPPSTVQMSIGSLQNVTPGNYSITVIGTSGPIEKTIAVELVVYDSLQLSVVLSTPSDGATGLPFNPSLSWQSLPDATSYQVEIAENPAFNALLESAVVSENSYQPNLVTAPGSVYYWRVRGLNPCNSGPVSAVFAFQTGGEACTIYEAVNLPVAIPDNQVTTVNATLNVPHSYSVSRVRTEMEIDHTWVGDVTAELVSPGGTVVKLFDQPGVPASQYGCSNDDLVLAFDDNTANAAGVLENMCNGTSPALNGSFQPIEPLANFTGTNSAGNWTLSINDNYPEDGGAITLWKLELCRILLPDAAVLLQNVPLSVATGQSETISSAYLQAYPSQGSASFILLSLPVNGFLMLNQVTLTVGDVFTQNDIDNGLLSYQHDGGNSISDEFQFDLLTSNHHWLHGQTFLINILQNNLSVLASLTQNISCHNANNGIITVNANGGTLPFAFSLNGGPAQASNVFENLGPGTYSVEVSDVNGFTALTNSVTVTNPPAISATASVNGDDLTITANGGTGSLQYSLDGNNFQASNLFLNLPNGTYSIIVQDANACTTTTSATVAVNTLIVSVTISQPISCFGGNDGEITVIVNGGTPPYQFSMNGGALQSSPVFENLSAGTYIFTVQDGDGFIQNTLPFTLSNPSQINASAIVNGYAVTITASGGTGDFEFSLDGGAFQSSNLFFPVPGGNHLVQVKDANGCDFSTLVTVNVPTLSVSATSTGNLPCWNSTNGVITATASGGVGPYQYSLNGGAFQSSNIFSNLPAGSYIVTIQDSGNFTAFSSALNMVAPPALTVSTIVVGNNVSVNATGGTPPYMYSLDGGSFQASNIFIAISGGTHTVLVTDSNGCEKTVSFTITVIPPQVSASLTQGVSCHAGSDGIITVFATGGIPPYQFSINGSVPQSSNVFSGLPPGDYVVTVIDMVGAATVAPVISISNPVAITASANAFGPVITVNASGGTGNLTFSLDGVNFQPDNTFEVTANGTYTITIRDEKGCTAQVNVIVNAPTAVFSEVTQISCSDAHDGRIIIQGVDGGQAPYLYSLNGGTYTSNLVYNNLGPGEYIISIQDATGYQFQATPIQIIVPEAVGIMTMLNGNQLTINASGGTPPFQYSVDGGVSFQPSHVFDNLSNGTYVIVVKDENDCTAQDTAVVNFTSATDVTSELSVEVFPNPSDGLFLMKTNLPGQRRLELKVFDPAGRLVFQTETDMTGIFETLLDLRFLANGTYQLHLMYGEKTGVKRLVITK